MSGNISQEQVQEPAAGSGCFANGMRWSRKLDQSNQARPLKPIRGAPFRLRTVDGVVWVTLPLVTFGEAVEETIRVLL